MRIISVSTLSICVVATLAASCGKRRREPDVDAGMDPSADLCSREPFKSQDICKGAIQVRVNTCPRIQISATPTRVAPGSRVLLNGSFFDAEGDPVTQEWFADPDGTLDLNMAPSIFYVCDSIGRKTITLVATDALDCESMEQVEVTCVDASSFENAGSDPLNKP